MNSTSLASRAKSLTLEYRKYAVCAIAVYGALFAFSRFAAQLPVAVLAVIWAALTAVATGGAAYLFLAKKLKNRQTQRKTGFLFRHMKGGVFRFAIAFALSAISIGCLMLSVARWGQAEWLIATAGIVACPFVFKAAEWFTHANFKNVHETSNAIDVGCFALTLILSVAAFATAYFSAVPHYSGVIDAYLAQPRPFANSASALLTEADLYYSYADGLTSYALSQVDGMSHVGHMVAAIVIALFSYSGLSLLLCSCLLPFERIREVFVPIDRLEDENVPDRVRPRYTLVGLACALPIALIIAFPFADARVAEAQSTQEYTAVERLMRSQIGQVAYAFDGKYYDRDVADAALAEIAEQSQQLEARVQNNLIPLVNASFDQQIDNIDSYLDWYYGLGADYERFFRTFTGTVENAVEDKLASSLCEGIDESALEQEYQACHDAAIALNAHAEVLLADCEITDIPSWLVVSAPLSSDCVEKSIESAKRFLDSEQRFAASAASGVASGVVVKKAVDRIVEKEVVGKMATKLARALGVKSASTVIGGVAGTAVPGIGNVVGVVAGTAIGVGVDFALLKADEAQNRQTYRDEIAQSIEEARNEMLAELSPLSGESEAGDAESEDKTEDANDTGEMGEESEAD